MKKAQSNQQIHKREQKTKLKNTPTSKKNLKLFMFQPMVAKPQLPDPCDGCPAYAVEVFMIPPLRTTLALFQ